MEESAKDKLPRATAKRLPLYLRNLNILEAEGVIRIKSREFAEITKIPSATIRRDFSYLGELGRSGYGYDVPYLIEVFTALLEANEKKSIAIVGFGNLGRAIAKNNFRRNDNLAISCVFDNNPALVGKEIAGFYVYDIRDLKRMVQEKNVSVVITTVPSENSQIVVDEIVASGVTAILNFSSDRVDIPKNVNMRYIDLTTELLTLVFFDHHYKNRPLVVTT